MIEIILAQLVVTVNTYIAFSDSRKNIYITTFLFNTVNLCMYLVKKDEVTVIMYIFITLRSFVYIYREKYINRKYLKHIIPFTFIIIQMTIGFALMTNLWQLLSILTPCYVCYYTWYAKDLQNMRTGNMINNLSWGIYNLHSELYIAFISRIATVISNIIAYKTKDKHSKVGEYKNRGCEF